MWNNFPWLLAVKQLMKGNINCASMLSVRERSENVLAGLVVVQLGSSEQPSQVVRGRGEPWTNCSGLKTCNFFSEVQNWMFPLSNNDGCQSCANKTDQGHRSSRKFNVKELPIKRAIDCCAGKAPAPCQADPGRASLVFVKFSQSFSVSFPR